MTNNIANFVMMTQALLTLSIFLLPLASSALLINHFELPKWLTAGFLLALMMICRWFDKKAIKMPSIPASWAGMLLLFVTLQISGIILKNPLVWMDYLYYVAIFFGYAYFFYEDLAFRGYKALYSYGVALLAGAVVISAIGLGQLATFDFVQKYLNSLEVTYAATFGNVNYAGQYIGICVLFFLYAMSVTSSAFMKRVFIAGIAIVITYFSFINTRSIMLAGFLIIVWSLKRRVLLNPKLLAKIVLSCTLTIVVAQAIIAAKPRAIIGDDRTESASIRLDLWRNTVQMIRDNPFGVGFRNFNFSFVPYRKLSPLLTSESVFVTTPHNEYLSVVAENGVLAGVVIFVLIGLILLNFYRCKKFSEEEPVVRELAIVLIVFFVVESAFQFPFEGAFPVVMFSLLVAIVFSSLLPQRTFEVSRCRWTFPAAGALIGYLVVTHYLAVLAMRYPDDVEKARYACEERPQDWFPCYRYAQALIKSGRSLEAQAILEAEIDKQPNNWRAMGLLGGDYLNLGKKAEGCKLYATVDNLFAGKSRIHDLLKTTCD